jgi:predicted HTH domain antitoxin
MEIIISEQIIKASHRSESELRLELAVFFYKELKMSLGKCAQFAGMNRFEFQEELGRRKVYMNYDEAAVLQDMESLKQLNWL